MIVPLGAVVVAATLTALVFLPGALRESRGGGGAMHAAPTLSLAAGLALGYAATVRHTATARICVCWSGHCIAAAASVMHATTTSRYACMATD